MKLTHFTHPLSDKFLNLGARHAKFATGGVMIANDHVPSGPYTGDMYVKGQTANEGFLALIFSKGRSSELGLPVAPFGSVHPDGVLINQAEALRTVYTAHRSVAEVLSTTVHAIAGAEPNQVTVSVGTRLEPVESAYDSLGVHYHRHVYSCLEWYEGWVRVGADGAMDGQVVGAHRVSLPLSVSRAWELFYKGAASSIDLESGARAKVLAECANSPLSSNQELADLVLNLVWNANDGRVTIGRGMGRWSELGTDVGGSIANHIATVAPAVGNKVWANANVPGSVRVVYSDSKHLEFVSAGGHNALVPYHVQGGFDVTGAGNVWLVDTLNLDVGAAAEPRRLACLSALCSEAFPASFETVGRADVLVPLDALAASVAVSSAAIEANAAASVADAENNGGPPIPGGAEWEAMHSDFFTVALSHYEAALRRVAS